MLVYLNAGLKHVCFMSNSDCMKSSDTTNTHNAMNSSKHPDNKTNMSASSALSQSLDA